MDDRWNSFRITSISVIPRFQLANLINHSLSNVHQYISIIENVRILIIYNSFLGGQRTDSHRRRGNPAEITDKRPATQLQQMGVHVGCITQDTKANDREGKMMITLTHYSLITPCSKWIKFRIGYVYGLLLGDTNHNLNLYHPTVFFQI